MRLFEYIAYFVPNEAQKAAGKDASILVDGKIIAENQEIAKRRAIRQIPAEYEDLMSQVQVEVRLFQ